MTTRIQQIDQKPSKQTSPLLRWRGAMLVAFVQIVQVPVLPDDAGGLSMGVGFGGGRYEQILSSCSGPNGRRDVSLSTVSGLVDYLITSSQTRISVFAGATMPDIGPIMSDGPGAIDFRDPPDGFFVGGITGLDAPTGAVQIGLMSMPGLAAGDRDFVFSGHGRIGPRAGLHVRADVNTARSPGQLPSSSLAIGFGSAVANTSSILVGIAELRLADVGSNRVSGRTSATLVEGTARISKSIMVTGGMVGLADVALWHAGVRVNAPLATRSPRR